MAYRSERFPAGELRGIERAWQVIDRLEASGLPVASEVMAGKSYRRQLDADTAAELGDPNYVLQAILQVPKRTDDKRISARYFMDEARRILGGVEAPGETTVDEGGLSGLDPSTTELGFGNTGKTENDILAIYAPWLSSKWTEASKTCMFFCGIEPPKPKALMEDHPIRWDEWSMRHGIVVFKPTPADLRTY